MQHLPPLPPPDPAFLQSKDGWPLAQRLFEGLLGVTGAPGVFARDTPIGRAAQRGLHLIVTTIEVLVRRLLYIGAHFSPKPNYKPSPARKQAMRATHGRGGFADDDSARWGVSFMLAPWYKPPRKKIKSAPRDAQKPVAPPPSNRALAERIEALGRVIANRELYVRRFALRLAARRVWTPTLLQWPIPKLAKEHHVLPAQIEAQRVYVAALRRNTS